MSISFVPHVWQAGVGATHASPLLTGFVGWAAKGCPYEDGSSERSKEIINQHRAVKAALMQTKGIKPV